MSVNAGFASSYVISVNFETDKNNSALAKASAWVTLQGSNVEVDTVVGDAEIVTVFYVMPVEAPAKVPLPGGGTGSLRVVGPGDYTTTNGSIAA